MELSKISSGGASPSTHAVILSALQFETIPTEVEGSGLSKGPPSIEEQLSRPFQLLFKSSCLTTHHVYFKRYGPNADNLLKEFGDEV